MMLLDRINKIYEITAIPLKPRTRMNMNERKWAAIQSQSREANLVNLVNPVRESVPVLAG
jgi:hypothetical protein